ncbi:hypothetical protein J7F03_27810 [Streptomyces sp. ISL-43]|uniref:vWA-MoxR associated conflict system protein n=1 Tax=Streptomyces sp. ISL-43 TaxID=2819183 RepID=UPI001BE7902E|nr:hypothetical protein [Streptomyces sp. ISL-43]MBT2450811.1 hypothetical protein [Streptomyces sp. ISL-43]
MVEPDSRRHVLVVAPHCASMPRLGSLEPAAYELDKVLRDAALGGCSPGLPDGGSLFVGDGLTSERVRGLVERAVEHAAERNAVLVLAMLGHGFVVGQTGTLHLMAADSAEEVRRGAVDVSALVTMAVDHHGVAGLIGIVDTCHAAGALPAAAQLTAGSRNGRTRMSLLMASSTSQPAYDLTLSRELTALLRSGVPVDEGDLSVTRVAQELRRRVKGQDVTDTHHNGDPHAGKPLWIARNLRYRGSSPGILSGPFAAEELASALGGLNPPEPVPRTHGTEAVRALLRRLEEGRPAEPDSVWDRAMEAADNLYVAVRTVEFLRAWVGSDLTTPGIRRALSSLLAGERRLPAGPAAACDSDVAVLDYLVFDHPVAYKDCRSWVTRFVLLLARAAGRSDQDPELGKWAEEIKARQELNDAVEYARRQHAEQRLSLVTSLHASVAGAWPESLETWLLLDGEIFERSTFSCLPETERPIDRESVEGALESAVLWARTEAEKLQLPLIRIHVAAPSALLATWRPEESGSALLLGVHHDVVMHWSERLAPSRLLRLTEAAVSARWTAIAGHTAASAPLDWLSAQETADPKALGARLARGQYGAGAIGLVHRPTADTDGLLDLLLAYTPVLMWPHGADDFAPPLREQLDEHWRTLPDSLLDTYRCEWSGGSAKDIAVLRLVWDNQEWLTFCNRFRVSGMSTSTSTSTETV